MQCKFCSSVSFLRWCVAVLSWVLAVVQLLLRVGGKYDLQNFAEGGKVLVGTNRAPGS